MCGIAGVVSEVADPGLGPIAAVMRDAISHRGPDAAGLFTDAAGCALGFRRLAIIDLVSGDQPMTTADGRSTVVFNGEIYNFAALRDELAGSHPFRTHSDTEVLLAGCASRGPAFISRLRGMFAFALWDARERRLLLARDRFGKKPLFWTRQGPRLYFASELKALLRVLPAPETDPVGLVQYLALGYLPRTRTIYRGIERLAPGCTLSFAGGHVSVSRYWDLPLPDDRGPSDERAAAAWEEKIAPLLDEAVRLRLISDVPLGAFLSGGLDSSTVVALALRHAARPFHTFSVRMEGGDRSDADAAFAVSKLLGTTHHELVMGCPTPAEAVAVLGHLDEPFADNSIFPTTAVSALARAHVTVSLSGDGGDELFGGYGVYQLLEWYERLARIPLLRPAAALLARAWPERARGHGFARRLGAAGGSRYIELVGHYLGAALERLTGDVLPKVDLASMSRSLEVRAPLLDHLLAEALATLPADLRMRGGRGKLLLRRIALRHLPEAIVERKKQGFNVPIEAWLRGGLRPLVEEHLAAPGAAAASLLDPGELRRLSRPPATAEDGRLQFTLLSLGVWASNAARSPR